MKLKNRLINFLQGRYIMYGTDSLTKFLFGLTIALMFINIILGNGLISLLVLVLIVYAYYRLLSKNIYKRYHENEIYTGYQNRFLGFFKNFKHNAQQAKTYHIYKCPNCKQKIRIPRGKGTIMVRCPKCHTEFKKRS